MRYVDWLNRSMASRRFPLEQKRIGNDLNVFVSQLDHAYSDEASSDVSLQLVINGEVHLNKFDSGFGNWIGHVASGNWILTAANSALNIDGEGDFELAMLCKPWASVQKDISLLIDREIECFDDLHFGIQQDPLVAVLATRIILCQDETELLAESLFAMMVTRWLQLAKLYPSYLEPRGEPLTRQQLRTSIDQLQSAVGQRCSLHDLASTIGCSRFQFLRRFKAATGFTPNDYLLRLRVMHAKTCIAGGDSLIDAAMKSGFADQPHMHRFFKRIVGVTPGTYQAAVSNR